MPFFKTCKLWTAGTKLRVKNHLFFMLSPLYTHLIDEFIIDFVHDRYYLCR
jgi:hypothetical protein